MESIVNCNVNKLSDLLSSNFGLFISILINFNILTLNTQNYIIYLKKNVKNKITICQIISRLIETDTFSWMNFQYIK